MSSLIKIATTALAVFSSATAAAAATVNANANNNKNTGLVEFKICLVECSIWEARTCGSIYNIKWIPNHYKALHHCMLAHTHCRQSCYAGETAIDVAAEDSEQQKYINELRNVRDLLICSVNEDSAICFS
ncbi:hypothetical protein M406DRAFT_68896 [Cryphonectria parasitica EP155]|uniref:Uncharacterized protein n=1 Tax=Cryphonectria parasitica (strain ATCC 38755 / EP155) TaxID=660469 RepID=A0A9P4Y5N9_CRYP1|nr:uncharacterized protein M406DRAFT_68896 [Cryphonectria parasitica EP155]KAF3766575.1 hypothetical protein M406DRAFT_68896 [Cryphonectria parasitica EP155]